MSGCKDYGNIILALFYREIRETLMNAFLQKSFLIFQRRKAGI